LLTDLQRRFCEIYIQHGGKNATECARLAGYSDASDAASVRAVELLRNEDVLTELRRLAQCRISAAVAVAASELEDIAADRASQKRATQLKAIESILNRSGLLIERISRLDVSVHHSLEAALPGESLRRDLIAEADSMGIQIVDFARFDAYCRSLDAIAAPVERPMIDVTPSPEEPNSW
jgi:hypothetical protein